MESCQWIQVRCEQGHGVDYDAQYYDIVQMGGNEMRVEWNAWGAMIEGRSMGHEMMGENEGIQMGVDGEKAIEGGDGKRA